MKVSCLVFRDSVQTVPLGRFFFVALPRIGETVVLASHPNDRFDVLEVLHTGVEGTDRPLVHIVVRAKGG
jgi:hypothetical protein